MVVGGAHPHPFSEPIGAKMNDVYIYISMYLCTYRRDLSLQGRVGIGQGSVRFGSGSRYD